MIKIKMMRPDQCIVLGSHNQAWAKAHLTRLGENASSLPRAAAHLQKVSRGDDRKILQAVGEVIDVSRRDMVDALANKGFHITSEPLRRYAGKFPLNHWLQRFVADHSDYDGHVVSASMPYIERDHLKDHFSYDPVYMALYFGRVIDGKLERKSLFHLAAHETSIRLGIWRRDIIPECYSFLPGEALLEGPAYIWGDQAFRFRLLSEFPSGTDVGRMLRKREWPFVPAGNPKIVHHEKSPFDWTSILHDLFHRLVWSGTSEDHLKLYGILSQGFEKALRDYRSAFENISVIADYLLPIIQEYFHDGNIPNEPNALRSLKDKLYMIQGAVGRFFYLCRHALKRKGADSSEVREVMESTASLMRCFFERWRVHVAILAEEQKVQEDLVDIFSPILSESWWQAVAKNSWGFEESMNVENTAELLLSLFDFLR